MYACGFYVCVRVDALGKVYVRACNKIARIPQHDRFLHLFSRELLEERTLEWHTHVTGTVGHFFAVSSSPVHRAGRRRGSRVHAVAEDSGAPPPPGEAPDVARRRRRLSTAATAPKRRRRRSIQATRVHPGSAGRHLRALRLRQLQQVALRQRNLPRAGALLSLRVTKL